MQYKGKLIVIEGIDSSGKGTQTKKLINYFKKLNYSTASMSFPRHGKNFFGLMVDDYLNNKFGPASKFDPKLASVLYAADRFEVKDKLYQWLNQEKLIILDRYASSNKAHQLSKLKSSASKKSFLRWVDELEYKIFGIPKPDIVIFLDVSPTIVNQLIKERSGQGKQYIQGKYDGHERDKQYLKKTYQAYMYLTRKYPNWHRVACSSNGKILTKDQIHQKIITLIESDIS